MRSLTYCRCLDSFDCVIVDLFHISAQNRPENYRLRRLTGLPAPSFFLTPPAVTVKVIVLVPAVAVTVILVQLNHNLVRLKERFQEPTM